MNCNRSSTRFCMAALRMWNYWRDLKSERVNLKKEARSWTRWGFSIKVFIYLMSRYDRLCTFFDPYFFTPQNLICIPNFHFWSQGYEPEYWWWKILEFFCTLLLCGAFVALLEGGPLLQISLPLLVSLAMMVALGNFHPYLSEGDDRLAQFTYMCVSLGFVVGLLEKAADEETSFHNVAFGMVLIVCVSVAWILGFGGIALHFCRTFLPEHTKQLIRSQCSRNLVRLGATRLALRVNPASTVTNLFAGLFPAAVFQVLSDHHELIVG